MKVQELARATFHAPDSTITTSDPDSVFCTLETKIYLPCNAIVIYRVTSECRSVTENDTLNDSLLRYANDIAFAAGMPEYRLLSSLRTDWSKVSALDWVTFYAHALTMATCEGYPSNSNISSLQQATRQCHTVSPNRVVGRCTNASATAFSRILCAND